MWLEKSMFGMLSLIKKIIFCFCILITNSYGAVAAADPFNFRVPLPTKDIFTYNRTLTEWLQTHEEGKAFIASGYTFPQNMHEFQRGGNKPLEAYRSFYTMRQARSSGASDQLGSTLRPLLQSSLGLADEHFAGPADQVMGHVASALGAQRQVADRAHDTQRRLAEEQVTAGSARRDADLQREAKAHLEREAETQRAAQEALETRHLLLQQRAHDAGIDVGTIEREITERLEKLRERDAMGSALDALRFLTHYAQSQAAVDGPLGQVVELNRKAKEFEQALKTRQAIEKDQLALPFGHYAPIPFFDITAYDRKFETVELQALLAWSVLQTSNKLTTADFTTIKQFAQLKQKDKPSEQEKKKIVEDSRDILTLADRVEKDLLWQAFHSEQLLYYDEIFFWASLGKVHKFNTERFTNIQRLSAEYAHFTTLALLKARAEALNKNSLRLFAFQITAVQRELNPGSTAAANFAFFDELNAASKKVLEDTKSYRTAVSTGNAGRFANHAHIAKLTKLLVADAVVLDIGDMHELSKVAFLEDLKKLEKLYFCLKESDADAASFMGLSKESGKLLNSAHSLVMQLVKYVTDYHSKVIKVLDSSVGAPLPAGVLGYERPNPVKINVVAPPTLAKHLVSVLDLSEPEKEVKKLDAQIAKLQKDLETKAKLRQAESTFSTIVGILDGRKLLIPANFGPTSPFTTFKKLSSNPGVSATIPEDMFLFFQELATNTALLQAILELEVVNLDSNYDKDLTLTGKDLVDCIADFAQPSRPPESHEVKIRVKNDRPQAKNIHIVPFFYYLCNDLLKLLQTEMRKIGATDLEILLHHLNGLVDELNALISATPKSKGDVRAVLDQAKFRDSVTASLRKVKFVDASTITITIKGGTANMTPQELIGLLPDLMDAYTAPPSVASSSPSTASGAVSSRVGVTTSSTSSSAPPPPPPLHLE